MDKQKKVTIKSLWDWSTDIVILNILWVIFSIPLITIGASTSALWNIMLDKINGDDVNLFVDFFISFKKNLKRSTVAFLLIIMVGILFIINFMISHIYVELNVLELVFLTLILLLIGFSQYLFPIIAFTDLTLDKLFKKSFFFTFAFFPKTILSISISIIPLLVIIFIPFNMMGIILSLLFFVAFSVWANAHLLLKIFSNQLNCF